MLPLKKASPIKDSFEVFLSSREGLFFYEFFYHPTWELIEENTVKFNGEAYFGEDEALFTIQFKVNLETEQFDITSYSINGESQTFDQFIRLLDTIYER